VTEGLDSLFMAKLFFKDKTKKGFCRKGKRQKKIKKLKKV
jgi:hypothetical protein